MLVTHAGRSLLSMLHLLFPDVLTCFTGDLSRFLSYFCLRLIGLVLVWAGIPVVVGLDFLSNGKGPVLVLLEGVFPIVHSNRWGVCRVENALIPDVFPFAF